MKQNLTLAAMIAALLWQLSLPVLAQSPTVDISPTKTASPSGKITPTTSAEDKDIQTIKNNIANTVQEITKKGRKATAGYITSIKDSNIIIKDSLNNTTNVKLDPQLTKVYQIVGTSKKELKQSDLDKNMYIIVSGPELDGVLNANVVYIDEEYFVKSGKIVEVNAAEGSLKITTSERDTVTINIDSRLKVQLMDSKTLDLNTLTSYSKVKEGDTVHFIYAKTGKEKQANTFDALKVIVIPQEYFMQK